MFRKLFLIVVVLTLAGCQIPGFTAKNPARPEYQSKPVSPLIQHGITKVAVLALNATNVEVDVRETSQIFATELQQFPGLRVFPAAVTTAALVQTKLQMPEEAHRFARQLGVDALIVVFITDYQPYENPRVGVMLRLYPAAGTSDEQTVARSTLAIERVYDSDVKTVADQVRAFAVDRDAGKSVMGDREYLRVMSKYMHFVADRSFRDFFAEAEYRGLKIGRGTMSDDNTKSTRETEAESSTPDAEAQTATPDGDERNTHGP